MSERRFGVKLADIKYGQAEAAFDGFTNQRDAYLRAGIVPRSKHASSVRSRYSDEQRPLVVTVHTLLTSLLRGIDLGTGEPTASFPDRVIDAFKPSSSFYRALNSGFMGILDEFAKRHENLMPAMRAVMVENGSVGVNTVFTPAKHFLERALRHEDIVLDHRLFYAPGKAEGVEDQCGGVRVAEALFYGSREAALKLSQIPNIVGRYDPHIEISQGYAVNGIDSYVEQLTRRARLRNPSSIRSLLA